MVIQQAKATGVIGIHLDECQHVLAPNAASNQIFLDSFKALMKESRWPLMLILSGIPSSTDYLDQDEQLAHLLRPVNFAKIQFDRGNEGDEESDLELLNMLAFALADAAEVDFEQLSTEDFLEHLGFACAPGWGLAIELIIDAFTRCRAGGRNSLLDRPLRRRVRSCFSYSMPAFALPGLELPRRFRSCSSGEAAGED